MSEEEAKARIDDMDGFVKFMENECSVCGKKRKDHTDVCDEE